MAGDNTFTYYLDPQGNTVLKFPPCPGQRAFTLRG